MKGQKEAVIEEVLKQVPTFTKYQDKAVVVLTHAQLEEVKGAIQFGITAGLIEYSKDKSNFAEVRMYARSMVMNHLKKAKELNGNMVPGQSGVSGAKAVKLKAPGPKGVDMSLLPEDLKDYVRKLV